MQPLFLAQKMMSLAATILLLQQMAILPSQGVCKTCEIIIYDPYKQSEMNLIYWVRLVKENNSNHILNKAMGDIDVTKGFEYTAEEEEADATEATVAAKEMDEDSGSNVLMPEAVRGEAGGVRPLGGVRGGQGQLMGQWHFVYSI